MINSAVVNKLILTDQYAAEKTQKPRGKCTGRAQKTGEFI